MMPPDMTGMGPMDGGGGGGMDPSMMPDISGGWRRIGLWLSVIVERGMVWHPGLD
jgi:hypothetical protein